MGMPGSGSRSSVDQPLLPRAEPSSCGLQRSGRQPSRYPAGTVTHLGVDPPPNALRALFSPVSGRSEIALLVHGLARGPTMISLNLLEQCERFVGRIVPGELRGPDDRTGLILRTKA